MFGIIIISLLFILWIMMNVILVGRKKTMFIVISTLIFSFVSFNAVHSFYASQTTVILLLATSVLFTLSMTTFIVIKYKTLSKKMMMSNAGWVATFILIMFVALIFRLFINHLNSDSIYYSWISEQIYKGTFINEQINIFYRIPTFYHVGAIFHTNSDYHTIFGEVTQLSLFAFGVNCIFRDIKIKNKIILILISILLGIASIYGMSFRTTSVNWSACALTMIFILANRKNIILILMTPLAMATFSFSPLLYIPMVMIFAIFKKKWDLREVIMAIIITIFSLGIVGIAFLKLPHKIILFLYVLIPVFLFVWKTTKFENKEVINVIYKFKIKNFSMDVKWRKNIFFVIFFVVVIAEVLMILFWADVVQFPLLMTTKVGTILVTIPIVFLILISHWIFTGKFSAEAKLMLFMTMTMIGYLILQIIPGVPYYLADRISLPFTAISPIIAMTCLIRWVANSNIEIDKFYKVKSGAIIISASTSCLMLWGNTTPGILWSPFTTNIEMNYKFVTNEEQGIINEVNTKDVIYSDIGLSSLEGINDQNLYFTHEWRKPFYGEMKTRMASFNTQNKEDMAEYYLLLAKYKNNQNDKNFKKELEDKISSGEIDKRVLNYKTLGVSIDVLNENTKWWDQWDAENIYKNTYITNKKINIFAFRNNEYANIVARRYSKKYKIQRMEKYGLHIIKLL